MSRAFVLIVLLDVIGTGAFADGTPAPAAPTSTTSSSSLADTTIHLYYLVSGYSDIQATDDSDTFCSAPGAQLKVGADDGTTLTIAVDTEKTSKEIYAETDENGNVRKDDKGNVKKEGACKTNKYVREGSQYKIAKSKVLSASPTIQGFVSGVLAVPFKFHLTDHSTTAGSTIGGYVGYRTSVGNQFSVTPVLSGGLALVSTSPAQVTSSSTTTSATTPAASTTSTTSQTSAGFSIATGLIGSVTSAASKGAQFGILIGVDWLGKKANYAYDGKPWIAFEIGYNFAL